MLSLNNIFTNKQCISVIKNKLKTDEFQIVDYQIKPSNIKSDFYLICNIKLLVQTTLPTQHQQQTLQFLIKTLDDFIIDGNSETPIQRQHTNNEMYFYEMIHNAGYQQYTWIPKLYGYFTEEKLLVMDDITTNGFRQCRLKTYLDFEHCEKVVCTLAKLHALTLQVCENRQKFTCTTNKIQQKCLEQLLERGTDLKLSTDEFKKRLHTKINESNNLLQSSQIFPNVLNHGNLQRQNIRFRYDEIGQIRECCFINFESVTYLPPIFDLLYFLLLNTTKEFQQQYFWQLIDFYYEKLLKNATINTNLNFDLKTTFSRSDFRLAIQNFLTPVKLLIMTHLMNEQSLASAKQNDVLISERSEMLQEILITDKLHRENCYEILNKKLGTTSDYKIKTFTLNALDGYGGYLGEHVFLKIYTHDTKIYSFFIKFIPKEVGLIQWLEEFRAFEREDFYYTKIFDEMKRMGIDVITDVTCTSYLIIKNYCAVFDDLSQQNYRICDKFSQLNLEQMELVIISLAKLHAASIIFEEHMSSQTNDDKRAFRVLDLAPNLFDEHIYGNANKNIYMMCNDICYINKNILTDIHVEHLEEKLAKIRPKFLSLLQRSPTSKYRNVLLHSDLWTNNVMFCFNQQNRATNCRLVDFQLGRYLPQACDVMYAMHCMINRTLREQHETYLLEKYYKCFSETLNTYNIQHDDIITHDEFMESCAEMNIFGLFHKALLYPFVMMLPEYEEIYRANEKLQVEVVNGNRDQLIRDNWEMSSKYRNMIYDAFIPILEYLKEYEL